MKSLKKIARVTVAVWPLLAPETEKLSGLAVEAESPETVTVLLSPAVMVAVLNAHFSPPVHDKVIMPVNELGEEALITNVVEVVPTWREVDRLLAESEKTAFPVPISVADCWLPEALLDTIRFPVRLPVAVGVKVMLTSQPSPTFSALGNDPQLFVSVKSPATLIAERVMEDLPVFAR